MIKVENLIMDKGLILLLDCASLPEMSQEVNGARKAKLDWSQVSDEDVCSYCRRSHVLWSNISLPKDANISSHCEDLCAMYERIVGSLYEAS